MKKTCLRKTIIICAALLILIGAIFISANYLITHRAHGRYFDSAGVRIHYTDEGAGEPVILIHGFAVNADLNWRRTGITDDLKKEYRVISMDLRGHGLSGKPHEAGAYGVEMARDVTRLMDHLKIKKAHVAGYSLGGFIALKLAVMSPERLASVSALGSGWENPDTSVIFKALPELESSLRAGRGVGPIAAKLGGKRHKPTAMHTFWVKLLTSKFNDQDALAAAVHQLPEFLISKEQVRGMHVPVCIIAGDIDPLKAGADALHGLAPDNTYVVIKDADHIHAPMRKELHQALLKFLRAHKIENE